MEFITKNWSHSTLCIGYKEKYIEKTVNTEFLGLQMDDHLSWKNHIEQMISKLREACSAIWWIAHASNINTLKSTYYEYFYSVIKYGIIFLYLFWQREDFHFTKEHFQLWPVQNPELHVEVYKNNQRFYMFHANTYFY